VPESQRLQTGIQSALSFVERAQKQDDSRLGIVGGFGQPVARKGQSLGGTVHASLKKLIFAFGQVQCAVQVPVRKPIARQAFQGDELEQRLFDLDLNFILQFRGKKSAIRAGYQLLYRIDQRPEARELNAPVRPQSALVKLG
jgi:hypothetical protein